MRSQKLNIDQPVEPIDAAEARMRLALGLTGAARAAPSGQGTPPSHPPASGVGSHDTPRARRRFAQDGDVPVVMIGRSRDNETSGENRLATLSTELRDERAHRAKAERALEEATLAIQSLKTKLAHTEIAFEERLRDEREARAQIEARQLQLQEACKRAETREAEATLALSLVERRVAEMESEAAEARRAAAAAAAKPKTDLFDDIAPAVSARKTRAPRAASVVKAKTPEPAAAPAAKTVTKRRTAKAAKPAPAEPKQDDQPIEWWLPSFRASRSTGPARKRKAL
ncbi:MAG TPA: hypothetical protein VHX12_10795 [Acidisoma sp.]|nr:hypothetical protein [Acidisoma sp.]